MNGGDVRMLVALVGQAFSDDDCGSQGSNGGLEMNRGDSFPSLSINRMSAMTLRIQRQHSNY